MQLIYRIHNRNPFRHRPKMRRRGMTLVETIIALIVVFVALAAILATVAQSAQLIARSREDLGIYTFASNWMELLEAQPPSMLANDTTFSQAMENVAKTLDPQRSAPGPVCGYNLTAEAARNVSGDDGIVYVTLSILLNQGTSQKAVRFEKMFNTISNATVSNDVAIIYRGDE